tara:strand:+ start:486 stop:1625 length:1140 start_codon:yes stop_codon:yes gene_type:complete
MTIREKFIKLKEDSGSHSPSINTVLKEIPEIKMKVDACFLSNPYATKLFLDHFHKDLIKTGDIDRVLEFYPSQNDVISKSISKSINIHSKNIFVCNGAIEGIQAILHNLLKGKISIPIPTFSSYYEYCHKELEPVLYQLQKEDNYGLNLKDYSQFIKNNSINNAVIINPNNPNGSYINRSEIIEFLDEHTDLDSIILDESFIHFAYENSNMMLETLQSSIDKYKNLFIVKSMSKDFGIAGLRCGYVLMNDKNVSNFLNNGYLWNINGIAEYFFNLYGNEEFLLKYEDCRKKYITETLFFLNQLKELKNINVLPSKANFVLVELLNGLKSEDVSLNLLINHGVYVRNCSDKVGLEGEYIRIAARSFDENQQIFNALKEIK